MSLLNQTATGKPGAGRKDIAFKRQKSGHHLSPGSVDKSPVSNGNRRNGKAVRRLVETGKARVAY